MGIFRPIVESLVLPVLHSWQQLLFGCPIAGQFIGDQHPWHVLTSLEQLAKELLGCSLVTPTLHQNVQHIALLIDSTPEVVEFAIDREEHLIEMPFITGLGTATTYLICVMLAKLATPLP